MLCVVFYCVWCCPYSVRCSVLCSTVFRVAFILYNALYCVPQCLVFLVFRTMLCVVFHSVWCCLFSVQYSVLCFTVSGVVFICIHNATNLLAINEQTLSNPYCLAYCNGKKVITVFYFHCFVHFLLRRNEVFCKVIITVHTINKWNVVLRWACLCGAHTYTVYYLNNQSMPSVVTRWHAPIMLYNQSMLSVVIRWRALIMLRRQRVQSGKSLLSSLLKTSQG